MNKGDYEIICDKAHQNLTTVCGPESFNQNPECQKHCWTEQNCRPQGIISKKKETFRNNLEVEEKSGSNAISASLCLPVFWLALQLNINAWDNKCRESINKNQKLRVWEFDWLAICISSIFTGDNSFLEDTPGQIRGLKYFLKIL